MQSRLLFTCLLFFTSQLRSTAQPLDYAPADKDLKTVLIDSHPRESFLGVRVDTMGRIFVGGRESLFVYDPDDKGGYQPRKLLCKFPDHTWVYDIEVRGNDLYVLTVSALYLIPDAVVKRDNLKPRRLIWGVPTGHVHQCFHALAWGPEGDLYFSMGDPLWYYGDFDRPDHWGHWTFFSQPEGTRIPYNGVGGVFRCRPDGSDFQIVARGLRNSCGLCFDRHWNLFTNDNDHEGLPALYVPGRLLHIVPHAYFSWPRGWMPFKTPDRADLLETLCNDLGRFVPVLQTYYDDPFLPEKYRHNLMVTRWCTRSISRFPLEHQGATFKAKEHPLLVGQNQVRPVGICVGRGGRLFATLAYMAHNEGSPVYQSDLVMITRANDAPDHPFEPYEATSVAAGKLWQELGDSSWQRRLRAHIELLRRDGKVLEEAAPKLAEAKADDPALHHLIWLTARSGRGHLALNTLTKSDDPLARMQAIKALTEYPDRRLNYPIFARGLIDPHPQVQHAALLAHFLPDVALSRLLVETIVNGPARSHDTYLRHAATMLLAERGTLEHLDSLCASDDVRTRLAGVLTAGFRLTLPPATGPVPDKLELAKFRTEEAFFAEFPDAKVDLRKFGRLGNYTFADYWKAITPSAEQQRLFALLSARLKDDDEQIRLQAAHFLSVLHDARSEPEVERVIQASIDRRLAVAPLKVINHVWVVGPLPDKGQGMKTLHPPEQGPIELAETYPIPGKKIAWQDVKPAYRYDLRKLYGPCDDASFYAYARLDSAGREKAHLLVGSDDGIKVWHNGKLVFTKEGVRVALPYQDVIPLDLQPGGNDLLVRVNNVAGDSAFYLHYRSLGEVVHSLPEKVSLVNLKDRLKAGGKETVAQEFLDVDWTQETQKGDAEKGRQLFAALACNKCHAVTNDATVSGGPSLADARKRFTLAYLVESVLLPSKQLSPVFKATLIETKAGKIITGLVVKETSAKIEVLLPDANRITLTSGEILQKRLVDQSPMPAGLVRTPAELRDVLAFLMGENPKAP